jgi:hypothetical protein
MKPAGIEARPNYCKKLTKRRLLARRPSDRLEQAALDGRHAARISILKAERAASRADVRCVKPLFNLCDKR